MPNVIMFNVAMFSAEYSTVLKELIRIYMVVSYFYLILLEII